MKILRQFSPISPFLAFTFWHKTFTNVMNIRQKEITSNMSPEEKKAIKQAKSVFAIRPPKEKEEHLSVEEEQAVDEFRKLMNQSK